MQRILMLIILLLSAIVTGTASGHESQPGSLEIKQLDPDRYDITWRAPIYYGKPHPAKLMLPEDWQAGRTRREIRSVTGIPDTDLRR